LPWSRPFSSPFFVFRSNNGVYGARSLALRPIQNPEDQVLIFMSPSDRVAHLYTQAPGSLFVAFYDSQSYGEDILTRLHAGKCRKYDPEYLS
jgi:hypothetical protein